MVSIFELTSDEATKKLARRLSQILKEIDKELEEEKGYVIINKKDKKLTLSYKGNTKELPILNDNYEKIILMRLDIGYRELVPRYLVDKLTKKLLEDKEAREIYYHPNVDVNIFARVRFGKHIYIYEYGYKIKNLVTNRAITLSNYFGYARKESKDKIEFEVPEIFFKVNQFK